MSIPNQIEAIISKRKENLPKIDKVLTNIQKCKDAGALLTNAGATYPYGKDSHDSNIRIAPSYPTLDELKQAASLFALCVKLVSVEKLLNA